MNYKLPILALAFAAAVIFQLASSRSSQPVDAKEVVSSSAGSPAAAGAGGAPESPNGQQLIAQAAQQLLVAPGLEAKTRQSVHIFDQSLVGSGQYSQLTNGPKLFLKLDLKLQVDDQIRSLRQVSDGESLWEIHSEGETKTVTHVSLGRLREVAGRTQPLVSPSFWMALGGLPRLMAKLEQHFTFQPAQPMTVGGHPVWSVEGEWKPEILAAMLPGQKEAILAGTPPRLAELPEQVPHGVTIILGRDPIIPLFPYSFSFHRDEVDDEQAGTTRRVAMLTWELFEVRIRSDLRPSDFDFRPSDQEFQERTEQYVAHLKAAAEDLARRQ